MYYDVLGSSYTNEIDQILKAGLQTNQSDQLNHATSVVNQYLSRCQVTDWQKACSE